ncbi:MAG: sugar transferase [Lachnospiraceae bacterium]|nr:sugar transferase [Lachnospiraceae bacterium]
MKSRNRNANFNFAYFMFDILLMSLAFFVTSAIFGGRYIADLDYYLLHFCAIVLVLVFNSNKRLYDTTLFFYFDRWLTYLTRSFIYANGLVLVLAFWVGRAVVRFRFFAVFIICEYLMLLLSAYMMRTVLRKRKGDLSRTLLVGSKEMYEKVLHYLRHNNMNVDVIGYVSENADIPETDKTPYLGVIDDLEEIIHQNSIDQVFFIQHRAQPVNYEMYVSLCLEMGLITRVIERPYHIPHASSTVLSIGPYPTLTYHNVVMNVYAKVIKRFMDIAGSIFGIIVFAIPMLIVAIVIKLDSKGPVIFKQERVGLNGRHFKMYKFRSMVVDAEARKKELESQNNVSGGLMFKIKDDPRITRVGKFIRKTSIDELPQLFNVLAGTMSLVGTRPPTVDEVEKYDTRHWRRLSIKPGITGMWQTSGRSEITDFEEVVSLDKQYIDNWSIWLDIKIIFKTVFQVFLKRKGAY